MLHFSAEAYFPPIFNKYGQNGLILTMCFNGIAINHPWNGIFKHLQWEKHMLNKSLCPAEMNTKFRSVCLSWDLCSFREQVWLQFVCFIRCFLFFIHQHHCQCVYFTLKVLLAHMPKIIWLLLFDPASWSSGIRVVFINSLQCDHLQLTVSWESAPEYKFLAWN